ncbi:MAG: glycosyltransferase family 2 protein [Burkholderiaceae bacterium]|nr:glycosyltransferase family 2 protein [Burkholderiaceae bacterium]
MIFVSLTTIRSRLERVDEILASLLHQSRSPDAILLNVSHEPFLLDEGIDEPDLERFTTAVVRNDDRIRVRFVENLGSYRKIVPALESVRDPDDIIVTADDDIPYAPHWLERLVEQVGDTPATPAYRCRQLSWDGACLRPYEKWPFVGDGVVPAEREPRLDLLPTSGAGIAFRRGYFDESDPLDELRRLAPMQDDIALRLLMLSKNVAVAWRPSDAHGERFEEFRSHENVVDLYRHNRRADWLGHTPNDAALRRVAALLAPRARAPEAREWFERIRRGTALPRRIDRRLRELYWEYRSARRREAAH